MQGRPLWTARSGGVLRWAQHHPRCANFLLPRKSPSCSHRRTVRGATCSIVAASVTENIWVVTCRIGGFPFFSFIPPRWPPAARTTSTHTRGARLPSHLARTMAVTRQMLLPMDVETQDKISRYLIAESARTIAYKTANATPTPGACSLVPLGGRRCGRSAPHPMVRDASV
jgi:hypothetical protein